MRRFGIAFGIEWSKLFKRKITIVLTILVVVMSIAGNGLNYYISEVLLPQMKAQIEETNKHNPDIRISGPIDVPRNSEQTFSELREEARQEVELRKAQLDQHLPEASDASYRNAVDRLAVLDYKLESGMVKAEDKNIERSFQNAKVNDVFNILFNGGDAAILFIMVAALLALSISGEYEKGTMKSMIVRPVSRHVLLRAKFCVHFIWAIVLQSLSFISTYVSGGLFFSFGEPFKPHVFALMGRAFVLPSIGYVILLYAAAVCSLLLPLAMVMLLAVLTRSTAATMGISLAVILLINNILKQLVQFFDFIRFTPFVNMNPSAYLTEGVTMDYTNILMSTILFSIYTVFAVLTSHLIFGRRDI